MSDRNFRKLLEAQWARGNFVCVGLDSDLAKIPEAAQVSDPERPDAFLGLDPESTIFGFNENIVDATKDLVCAYKPNVAFYEAHGERGLVALRKTTAYINKVAPDVPVILDAKRGDIGNTNAGYVEAAFNFYQADAITVHPYLGSEALQPFLARADKGVIVLCRTSNPGAGEFQDLLVDSEPLYRFVARRVANKWNKNGNCALVVGATYPDELRIVRQIVGDMTILVPGVGFQQKNVSLEEQVKQVVNNGKDSRGWGMIINSSRGIIFASKGADFAEVARHETLKLHDIINQYR